VLWVHESCDPWALHTCSYVIWAIYGRFANQLTSLGKMWIPWSMPNQFIFLQFTIRHSSLHSMDHHLSHRLHRPVLLHLTRGWQPPLMDSLDLLILANSYTTTITPTWVHEEGYSGRPSHLESSYVRFWIILQHVYFTIFEPP
jgi:hypothetical protein